jgi:glyoxylase-like metal-dependent hydrolase (beta-lactamase superfamily II)
VAVRDGEIVLCGGFEIGCVHTPGHVGNHMCYALPAEKALFCGDHVMGWSTSVIAPPDGDMAAYMASLEKLLARDDATYWPTHGGPIRDPHPFVEAYLGHRREREAQILAMVAAGHRRIPDITAAAYAGLDPWLMFAAALSVQAHLVKLAAEGRVAGEPDCRLEAEFRLRP